MTDRSTGIERATGTMKIIVASLVFATVAAMAGEAQASSRQPGSHVGKKAETDQSRPVVPDQAPESVIPVIPPPPAPLLSQPVATPAPAERLLLGQGDTLYGLLLRNRLAVGDVAAAVQFVESHPDSRLVKVGDDITIERDQADPSRLLTLTVHLPGHDRVSVGRGGGGVFVQNGQASTGVQAVATAAPPPAPQKPEPVALTARTVAKLPTDIASPTVAAAPAAPTVAAAPAAPIVVAAPAPPTAAAAQAGIAAPTAPVALAGGATLVSVVVPTAATAPVVRATAATPETASAATMPLPPLSSATTERATATGDSSGTARTARAFPPMPASLRPMIVATPRFQGHHADTERGHADSSLVRLAALGDMPIARPQASGVRSRSLTITGDLRTALAGSGLPTAVVRDLRTAAEVERDFRGTCVQGATLVVTYETLRDGTNVLRSATARDGSREHRVYRVPLAPAEVAFVDDAGSGVSIVNLDIPVDRVEISSGWGWRTHPVLGVRRFHRGIDYRAPRGTPARATADGIVEDIGRRGNHGLYVRLRHSAEVATTYSHLDRFAADIEKGTLVRKGTTVGTIGTSGMATGPHLYYEVLIGDRHVNPLETDSHVTPVKLNSYDLARVRKALDEVSARATRE